MVRCTIALLMKTMGLTGVLRGKKVRTAISRKEAAAENRVNRQFVAERPNQLSVADFIYVSTWQGFAYMAFIMDVLAGHIAGWQVLGPAARPAPSITRIKIRSTYRWRTHRDCRMPNFWPQLEAQVTLMITRWQKASTTCTRRRQYIGRAGKTAQRLSWRH